jgi:pyruvate kinase
MLEDGEAILLSPGEQISLTTRDVIGTKDTIQVKYDSFAQDVNEGDRILLDDGRIELCVTSIDGNDVATKIIYGGKLGSKKGIPSQRKILRISSLDSLMMLMQSRFHSCAAQRIS